MNVMLLAAGEGTRLRPYTNILPKPAMPFLNIPLACYSLAFLHNLKINKLVVNTYHLPEKIAETFKSLPHGAQELHFSDEIGEILGSSGGLNKAKEHFITGNDFIMMNADEIILPKTLNVFEQAYRHHQSENAIATLIVMKYPGVGSKFGGVWTAGNKVLGFGKEKIQNSTEAWHFIGPQILNPKIFEYIPQTGASNILYDAITKAISAGEKVQIYPIDCTWFETGNPHDFLEATQHCLQLISMENHEGEFLKSILKKYSIEKINFYRTLDALCLVNASAQISSEAKISGFVCAGKNSKIESNTEIHNVCIGQDKHIANAKLENTILI